MAGGGDSPTVFVVLKVISDLFHQIPLVTEIHIVLSGGEPLHGLRVLVFDQQCAAKGRFHRPAFALKIGLIKYRLGKIKYNLGLPHNFGVVGDGQIGLRDAAGDHHLYAGFLQQGQIEFSRRIALHPPDETHIDGAVAVIAPKNRRILRGPSVHIVFRRGDLVRIIGIAVLDDAHVDTGCILLHPVDRKIVERVAIDRDDLRAEPVPDQLKYFWGGVEVGPPHHLEDDQVRFFILADLAQRLIDVPAGLHGRFIKKTGGYLRQPRSVQRRDEIVVNAREFLFGIAVRPLFRDE